MEYVEWPKLVRKNNMIKKMEQYFLKLMDNQVLTYAYSEVIYTEGNFRIGMELQYLGDSFYGKMKAQISASFDCVRIVK